MTDTFKQNPNQGKKGGRSQQGSQGESSQYGQENQNREGNVEDTSTSHMPNPNEDEDSA